MFQGDIMKVALLSRISTSEQSNESALEELKRVALNKGYNIYDIYEEVVSGAQDDRNVAFFFVFQ